MADVHDKATRSKNMAAIKSKNTKPEMLVRKFLYAQGFRYRLHGRIGSPSLQGRAGVGLPGKPDIVLPKYKTVIFIHGCFWHGHKGCKYFVVPKTRTEWWLKKINSNIANDAKAAKALKKDGWKIIILWTCELKTFTGIKTLKKLAEKILPKRSK
jgi:DNA mismatch endonuclease (patch repair protein)